jgi:N utilization substance protein A
MDQMTSPGDTQSQDNAIGFRDEIAAIGWLNAEDVMCLLQNGIQSLDDLADLASDELLEIVGTHNLTMETANRVIMAARAHWFEDDLKAAE